MALGSIASGLLLIAAYLLGSIPTGYLAGRILKGIDIREVGSGSTGATNVLRAVGKWPALMVLLVDAAKGAAAIGLVRLVDDLAPTLINLGQARDDQYAAWLAAVAGLAAILGHSKSIWLNFTGGKSVATGLGVLLAMCWPVGLGTLGVFGVFLALWRIVSLSSIAGAIAVSVLAILFKQPLPYQLFAGAAGLYVIWRHRSNIQRLLAGTEPQLGQQIPAEPAVSND